MGEIITFASLGLDLFNTLQKMHKEKIEEVEKNRLMMDVLQLFDKNTEEFKEIFYEGLIEKYKDDYLKLYISIIRKYAMRNEINQIGGGMEKDGGTSH